MTIASPRRIRTAIRTFAPYGTLGGTGAQPPNTPPFGLQACGCHAAVKRDRNAILTLAQGDGGVNDHARAALAQAQRIDWQGRAADLYRQRLRTFAAAMDAYDCDAISAMRLAQGGGS